MTSLLRTCAALIAIYGIALQALLSGYLTAAHPSFDPLGVICASGDSGHQAPVLPQHHSECVACLAAHGASPAVVPATPAFSPAPVAETPKALQRLIEALLMQSAYRPQKSRAPPIAS